MEKWITIATIGLSIALGIVIGLIISIKPEPTVKYQPKQKDSGIVLIENDELFEGELIWRIWND